MDTINKLSGGMKAAAVVVLVLALTGALVLLAAEKSERGFLGVSVQRLDDDDLDKLGVQHGVRVAAVEKGSAAEKAGILKDDVILTVNGEKVRNPQTLTKIVREQTPGSTAKIALWRGGKGMDVKAVVGKLEPPKRPSWNVAPFSKIIRSGAYLGISLLEPDADLAAYFSIKAGEGVLVGGVEKDTPAAKAGLKSGDVIVQMADQPVKSSKDIHKALAALNKGDTITITVMRRGQKQSFKTEPDFTRRKHVMRFFDGDKDFEIEHLELPELLIEAPEPPEPPDLEEIERHVREKLEHVHEKLDQAKITIKKQLKKAAANYWI